jgi:hypothetical protein
MVTIHMLRPASESVPIIPTMLDIVALAVVTTISAMLFKL